MQTKIVVGDFCGGDKGEFYEGLVREMEGLDVSVLVNNVGWMMDVGLFCGHAYEDIGKEMTINLLPIALLTHKLLPRMLARPSRSAIINLASSAIYANLGGSADYCSTKAYDDIFSRSL